MILGRIIGWIVLIAGLSVLVRDVFVWVDTGHWLPLALGEGWRGLDRASFDKIAGLWPPLGKAAYMAWACGVLIGIGVLLLYLSRRRVRRHR